MRSNAVKKILVTLLAFFCACSIGAFALNRVHADGTERVFAMVEGASIRLVEDSNGIRFSATLSSYDDNNDYGFVIVPRRYIEDNSITDNYVTELQALAQAGTISEPIILRSKVHEVEGKNVIKGSITNILYENINLEFVGIGFEYDGTTYNYASFEDLDDIARSAPRVAAACLNELYYDADIDEDDKLLYEDAEDVLKGYINTSINAKAGLSEDESNATTPEYSVAFASSEVSVDFGATKQLEVTANVPMENAVWSSDSDIIVVDENGLVTAKGVGSAIITVKSAGKQASCTVNVAEINVADGYIADFNNDGYKYGVSAERYSGFWKADAVSAEYVANGVTGAKDGDALKVTVDIAKCRENKGMSYFVINFLANKGANLTGEMIQIRFKATYNGGANNVDPFGYVINGSTAVLNGIDSSADIVSVNLNASNADDNGWRELLIPASSITGGAENVSTLGLIFYKYVGVDDGEGEIYLDYIRVMDKLSAPTNLSYASGTLTWDAVANATSYVAKYDGQEYPVATNSIAVGSGKTVVVKAVAEGYLDSDWSTAFATVSVPNGYLADYNSVGYEGMIVNGVIDKTGEDRNYWLPSGVSATYVASDVVGAKDGDALSVTISNNKNGYSAVTFTMPTIEDGSLNGTIMQIRYRLMEGSDSKQAFLYSLSGNFVDNIASMSSADGDGWQVLTINVANPYSITSVGLGFYGLAKNGTSTLEIDYVRVMDKLSAPTNLSYVGGTLSWDAVANATSYVAKYDGQEYPVATNSIAVGSGKTVTVKAVAEGYLDSDWSNAFVTVGIPDGYVVDYNSSAYESMISNDAGDGYWKSLEITTKYEEQSIAGAENGDAMKITASLKKKDDASGMVGFKLTFPTEKGANLKGDTIQVRFHAKDLDGTSDVAMFLNYRNGAQVNSGLDITTADADGWRILNIPVAAISGGASAFSTLGIAFWPYSAISGTANIYIDYVKVVQVGPIIEVPNGYLADYNTSLYESMINNGHSSTDGHWASASVSATYVESGVAGAENGDALMLTLGVKGGNRVGFQMKFSGDASVSGTTVQVRLKAKDGTEDVPVFLFSVNDGSPVTSGFSTSPADADGWRIVSIPISAMGGVTADGISLLGLACYAYTTDTTTAIVYLDYVKVV